jgi:hypothetical protein
MTTTPIRLCDPPNFDSSPGKAKAFLHQLRTFVTQQALFHNDEHKVASAVSLLSDNPADWATGFAADGAGYQFASWGDFVNWFQQHFVSPVPTLNALS